MLGGLRKEKGITIFGIEFVGNCFNMSVLMVVSLLGFLLHEMLHEM